MKSSLESLNEGEMDMMLQAAEEILRRLGVSIQCPKIEARLLESGCEKTGEGRVSMPWHVVEAAFKTAPRSFSIFGRDGRVATVGYGSSRFHNFGTVAEIVDEDTHSLRPATCSDVADITLLLDALDLYDIVCAVLIPNEGCRFVPSEMGGCWPPNRT